MSRILMPLPDRDFDVTEVAVPWRLLTRAGHRVDSCTEPGGAAPAADPLLRGPRSLTRRDDERDSSPAFVVTDGHYVSARWPGDAYTFAKRFESRL